MQTDSVLNIERAVLSTIIFDPKRVYELESLKIDDFYHPFHQHLYKAILELNEQDKPIDEEFLKEQLQKSNNFDEIIFLDVLSTTPISNLSVYVEEIREHSKALRIKELALKIAKNIDEDNANVNSVINYLETELENLQKSDVSIKDEDISLKDMLSQKTAPKVVYSTGLEFLDKVLDGGFEMGQLVTITGEQESGKTQLVNQILFNIAQGFKCLYFSLEFNKRQLIEYTKHKIKTCNFDIDRFDNIKVITDEMTTGNIDDVIIAIKQKYRKYGTKFVVIDSQMMIYEDDENNKYTTSEEKITSIFRKLHNLSKKLDICILLIAQSSKEDNKSRKIEIFGSKKAAHIARIMIHINYDREKDAEEQNGIREIFIAKNKQNGKIAKIQVFFDKNRLEFIDCNNSNPLTKVKKAKSALELI